MDVRNQLLVFPSRLEFHRINLNFNLVLDNLPNRFTDRRFQVFCANESKVQLDRFGENSVASEENSGCSIQSIVVVDFEVRKAK